MRQESFLSIVVRGCETRTTLGWRKGEGLDDSHIAMHITPGKHAVKNPEMAVRRALAFYEVFERWEERFKSSGYQGVQDWRDIDPSEWRKIMSDGNNKWYDVQPLMELEELWKRFKSGELARQVLELAENLPMDKLSKKSRKEIEDGLARIRG